MLHNYRHVPHRDSQIFDRVDIQTKYRYKESYMSGDEWRYSAVMTIYYKDQEVFSATFRDVETAMQIGYGAFVLCNENGKYQVPNTKYLCDQEGCSQEANHYFQILERFDNEGNILKKPYEDETINFRKFCTKHKHRGDCSLEDADDNYQEINNPYVESE